MDLSKIRVCIFDVNGVLIDSNAANARAMAEAFTHDPVLQKRIAAHYLTLTGVDRGSKIRIIQEQVIGLPFKEHEFDLRWERFKNLARQSMEKAPLVAGCKEVLTALGKEGITRMALSNTPLGELQEILAAHGLDALLDVVRGGGDWPKSDSLLRLVDECQFQRDQALFCGDGKKDLVAARSAGLSFVAIDPGTGEFDGEEGFHGPFRDLAEWGEKGWV
ncbi:MAG: HAD hydrolase-like protein [Thermodesulfobacteriota bacterium]|nr:HAD hydrolase-like protein [Thermodesulfobacteriota bacterium]